MWNIYESGYDQAFVVRNETPWLEKKPQNAIDENSQANLQIGDKLKENNRGKFILVGHLFLIMDISILIGAASSTMTPPTRREPRIFTHHDDSLNALFRM